MNPIPLLDQFLTLPIAGPLTQVQSYQILATLNFFANPISPNLFGGGSIDGENAQEVSPRNSQSIKPAVPYLGR